MSANAKVSGTWKGILAMFVKVSGVWKPASFHTKANGVWKIVSSPIPMGFIALFKSNPPPGWKVCDGTNGTPNFIGRFLYPNANPGQTGGGCSSHDHGSESVSWSVSTNTGVTGMWHCSHNFPSYSGSNWFSVAHAHTLSSTHSNGIASGDTSPLYYTLIPAMIDGAVKIPAGTILLRDDTTIPDGWARLNVTDKYLLMNSTANTTGGGGVHSHSTSSNAISSSAGSPRRSWNGQLQASSYGDGTSHTHSVSHSHTSGGMVPQYKNYLAIEATSDGDSVPSGCIGLCVLTTAPSGYSFVGDQTSARLVRLGQTGTVGAAGGSNSHSHNHQGLSLGNASEPTTYGSPVSCQAPNCCTNPDNTCNVYEITCCVAHAAPLWDPLPPGCPQTNHGQTCTFGSAAHSHGISVSSDSVPAASTVPSYITVRLLKKS